MPQTDLFISYSSKDAKIAEEFIREFQKHNISCWVDSRYLHKEETKTYWDIIHRSIRDAKAYFLLLTPNSNGSENVMQNELAYALKLKKPILCMPLFPKRKKQGFHIHPNFKGELGQIQWLSSREQIERIPDLKDYIESVKKTADLQKLIGEESPNVVNNAYTDIIFARIGIQRFLGKPITTFGKYTCLDKSETVYALEDINLTIVDQAFYWDVPEERAEQLRSFFDEGKKRRDNDASVKGRNIDCNSLRNELFDFIRTNNSDLNTDQKITNFLHKVSIKAADKVIDEEAKKRQENKVMFNGPMIGIYDIDTSKLRTPGDERHQLHIQLYRSDYFTFKFMSALFHELKMRHNTFDIHPGNIRQYAPFLCSLGLGGFTIVKQGKRLNMLWAKRSKIVPAGGMWHFSYDETVHAEKDLRKDEAGKYILTDRGEPQLDIYKAFERAIKEENGLENHLSDKYRRGIFEIGLIESDRLEVELLSYAIVEVKQKPSIEEQLERYTDYADDKIEISEICYIPLKEAEIVKQMQGKFLTPESYGLAIRLLVRDEKQELLVAN